MTGEMSEGFSGRDEVTAVMVTYHPDAELPARVNRILDEVGSLVVVDNGSTEEALAMLRTMSANPRVALVTNGANLGVGRALNLGIERARTSGARFVLLLDQDSLVHEGMTRTLLAVRAAYPEPERLAVIGAGFDGSETLAVAAPAAGGAGGAGGAADAAGEAGMAGIPAGAQDYQDVESVITSGSLIPLTAHAVVGPFREEFFIDYVDTDYCFRARAKGFAVITTRKSLMSHAIGAPTRHSILGVDKWTSNHSPDRRYYMARNDTVMLRESGRYALGSWAVKSLGRRLRTAKRVVLYERSKRSKLVAIAAGWWDGVRGRLGPRHNAR
jgi:rhamnosyltransferase